MTDVDWSDVPGRVARLAADPVAHRLPGAWGHGWEFEPALSAVELAEVEAQLRVELPPEYRSFLLQVGRGLVPACFRCAASVGGGGGRGSGPT